MERETETHPDIDMTAPGSETDQADGAGAQIPFEDMLEPHVTDDVLDEGYSPPDYPPAVDVPTPQEELEGEGLDRRLAEEVPEVDATLDDEDSVGGVGSVRSGRLAPDDGDGRRDDVLADDAGIAGGAASAEEAAVHVLDEDGEG